MVPSRVGLVLPENNVGGWAGRPTRVGVLPIYISINIITVIIIVIIMLSLIHI